MVRRYGRALRGERLVCKVPFGRWETMTFIAALRQDRITAPLLLDGPMNGQSFRAYVEQMLAPTLKPGDSVVMDNVRMHKVPGVREAIEARGASVPPFPPYSPDLNPIEQTFAKLKHWMRMAQKRTVDDVWRHIGSLVTTIGSRECAAYFANAGYASVKM